MVAQTLQTSSIRKPPPLRGKQKLKIIIYDNFEYLHSYLRKIFSIDFPFEEHQLSIISFNVIYHMSQKSSQHQLVPGAVLILM